MTKQRLMFVWGIIMLCGIAVAASGAEENVDLSRGNIKTEVTISPDGVVNIRGAVVIQKADTNIFTQTKWGTATIRWVITVSTSTEFARRFGAVSNISEITIGERLNIEGILYGLGGDSLVVKAKKIRNWNKEDETAEFSGVAANINYASSTMTIILKDHPNIVAVLPTNLSIKKGARIIGLNEVKNGDRIIKAKGVYNPIDRILVVETLEVFQEKSIFDPKNFQGTLKSLEGTSLPTSIILVIDGKEYLVHLGEKTEVLNKLRGKVLLQRFVAGDTIRVYGAIEQTNLSNIKAEIVRNISL